MAFLARAVRTTDYLRVAIDLGAGSIKIARQHVRAGTDPRNVKVVPVKIFEELRAEILSTMIYDDDDNAFLGHQAVSDWTKHRPDEIVNILDLFKLAICYEYESNDCVKNIRRYLRQRKGDFGELQMMFTDIFKVILNGIRKFDQDSMSKLGIQEQEDLKKYWEDIHIELQLPMPSHWDKVQQGILFEAAKAAGFKEVIIRSETLCAAASLCEQYYYAGDLYDDDHVLIVDIGCSTTGVATVAPRKDENDDLTLVEIGYSDEHGVGGQSVTDRARRRLPMSCCSGDFGTLENLLNYLDITSGEFYRQFSSEFEICKRRFPAEEGIYPVTIRGHHARWTTFGLSKEFMTECFEFVAKEMVAVISKHLQKNVGVPQRFAAILCGGGAQNEFNRKFIARFLAHPTIRIPAFTDPTPHENHVAHGALGRYPEPETATLPKQLSLYMALAVGHKAYKLIRLFSSKPGFADESQTVSVDFSFSDYLNTPGPRLRPSIYGSERDDLENKTLNIRRGKRREDVEEWPLHFADPLTWSGLEEKGVMPEGEVGRKAYNITSKFAIARRDGGLWVTTKIYAEDKNNLTRDKLLWEGESELWNANRSHNVSNGRAPVRELPPCKRARLEPPSGDVPPQRKSPRKQRSQGAPVPKDSQRPGTTSQTDACLSPEDVNVLGRGIQASSARCSAMPHASLSPLTSTLTSPPASLPSSPVWLPQIATEADAILDQIGDRYGASE